MCEHHGSYGGSTNTLEYILNCKVALFARISADKWDNSNYVLALSCCQQRMYFVF